MAAVAVANKIPASGINGPMPSDIVGLNKRYFEEREKRLEKNGDRSRYIYAGDPGKLQSLLQSDPWPEADVPIQQVIDDGQQSKFLVVGAGFGGILFAAELIKSGYSTDDILIVDPAGGFGGTWYWNRYPGLMCDIESYIYLPLIEETGYMPKHKYASGEEIRKYCELLAEKYGLHPRAMFRSRVTDLIWDNDSQRWKAAISQSPKDGLSKDFEIEADYVYLGAGIFPSAKLPAIPGLESFQGEMLHTARWRYDITGGLPTKPDLDKLGGKRVGIIGTGASAVQVVPHLAKWSSELVVYQRTPSAVGERGNQETDVVAWNSEIAAKPGWHEERCRNFLSYVTNAANKPEVNAVGDGWTRSPAYGALIGGPDYNVTPQNVQEHVGKLLSLDIPHQEAVRQRTLDTVEDQDTAKKLQAWYPTYCKRPCFHDEYLQSFNAPNVRLIDGNGQGVTKVTPKGVIFAGQEYELDVIIWSTGYTAPTFGNAASKALINLIGRTGQTVDQKFAQGGMATLHGYTTRDFPNLFWPGVGQAGASPNVTYTLHHMAKHVAHIIAKAEKEVHGRAIIEPSHEAEEGWSMRCLAGAAHFAPMAMCTPGYLNNEGNTGAGLTPEQQMLAGRAVPWSKGALDFIDILKAWRDEGKMAGLEVTAAA